MMRAVTAFFSLPLACGGDIQLGNPAVDVGVVIDGAGCAGMEAADHLHKAGVSFVVLEAQSHTERKDKDAGFGVSLGGIILYRGFQLGALDTIVGFVEELPTVRAIIVGAGISYPFDIGGRLQMQAEQPVEQHIYKGTVDSKLLTSLARSL